MLREGWNFHGDIAIELEGMAARYFNDPVRPMTKIYDADDIESGCFVEVMIILLRESTNMENNRDDIDQFVKDCRSYLGKRGTYIPKETAQNLFDSFKAIYDDEACHQL